VETDEVPANHVVSELVRGYTLHDRLMRPALVAVSKAKASNGGPDSSPAPTGAGS
jgi:molecular chaperone GrpE